ncbi:MAG: MFS transporter [Hyphomicrobiaceae bacterium]
MSTLRRYPLWLSASNRPGIGVFAILFFIEAMARASILSVVPLQAYHLFQDNQTLSFLYTGVAVFGLLTSLMLPVLIRLLTRKWVYTLGATSLIACFLFLYSYTIAGQALGMMARTFATACLNIAISLYIMDFIRKEDLVRNDAVRLSLSTVSWTLAPYIGIWLYENVSPGATFLWAGSWVVLLIAVFWYFRMSDHEAISPARMQPSNLLENVPRFIRQPRLRLAWLIAFTRSSFWTTVFIYGPVLMVSTGQPATTSGLLVAALNVSLVTAYPWGRLGERIGIRPVAALCFLLMGFALLLTGFAGEAWPLVAAALLVIGSIFASGLDAVAAVPFYRAVKPRERPEMTSVYRTFLDIGELLPTMIYGILLGFFGLGSVFTALGLFALIVSAVAWRFVPRSM